MAKKKVKKKKVKQRKPRAKPTRVHKSTKEKTQELVSLDSILDALGYTKKDMSGR